MYLCLTCHQQDTEEHTDPLSKISSSLSSSSATETYALTEPSVTRERKTDSLVDDTSLENSVHCNKRCCRNIALCSHTLDAQWEIDKRRRLKRMRKTDPLDDTSLEYYVLCHGYCRKNMYLCLTCHQQNKEEHADPLSSKISSSSSSSSGTIKFKFVLLLVLISLKISSHIPSASSSATETNALTDPLAIAARDNDVFEVESIINHFGDPKTKSKMDFQVRWLGFDASEDRWLPWSEVRNLPALHTYLRANNMVKLIPKKYL
jgi:hypothetical protein